MKFAKLTGINHPCAALDVTGILCILDMLRHDTRQFLAVVMQTNARQQGCPVLCGSVCGPAASVCVWCCILLSLVRITIIVTDRPGAAHCSGSEPRWAAVMAGTCREPILQACGMFHSLLLTGILP